MTHAELPAWKMQLPMWLTWARMVLCLPMIAIMLLVDGPWAGYGVAALFIIASITDWLDGYYARLFNAQTTMGKFMDPIADKILVSTVLILLIPSNRVGPLVVILLLARDILIGGIRSIAAADRVIIDAKATGKWKTAMQMVAIPALLINTPLFGAPIAQFGSILLWISVLLSVISGWEYIQIFRTARRGT